MMTARFRQFEEVMVKARETDSIRPIEARLTEDGVKGVVIWCDRFYSQEHSYPQTFTYVVHFPSLQSYLTMAEQDLISTQIMHDEHEYLGQTFEISFDLQLSSEETVYRCMEGCIRTPGKFWQTFFIWHQRVPVAKVRSGFARSGIELIECAIPKRIPITKALILRTLGEAVGTTHWLEVNGPDSLVLK